MLLFTVKWPAHDVNRETHLAAVDAHRTSQFTQVAEVWEGRVD